MVIISAESPVRSALRSNSRVPGTEIYGQVLACPNTWPPPNTSATIIRDNHRDATKLRRFKDYTPVISGCAYCNIDAGILDQ